MNVLFLADKFSDSFRSKSSRYVGGAERTDAAAIAAAPGSVTTATWNDVPDLNRFDVIIAGNSSDAEPELLLSISESGRLVMFEHDLRICRWRGNFPVSLEPSHRFKQQCGCRHQALRPVFENAAGTIFLTELQKSYFESNPHWNRDVPHAVLGSSLFERQFLDYANSSAPASVAGTAYLSTKTKIKGSKAAKSYCEQHGWNAVPIENMTQEMVWETMREVERFVYLPIGLEPAGRMPVEARLLKCEVIVNEHVGVAGEPIWQLDDAQFAEAIAQQPARFWELTESFF